MLYTDAEPHLILGPEYAEEVKAHPDLSFRAYTQTVSCSSFCSGGDHNAEHTLGQSLNNPRT
jgi:hypothetical protein